MMNTLVEAMKNLEEDKVIGEVQSRLQANEDPIAILEDLQDGMRLVGDEYEKGSYYLSELIMSAVVFQKAAELLSEKLSVSSNKAEYGTFVIGTVKDDIHDIGKNIAATLLGCRGFNVVDLGVDVPADQFIEAIKEHKPAIVGLSCLLTTAFDSMKNIVDAIEEAGLRAGLSILIGGATIDANTANYVGADAFCLNANDAVITAQKMSGGAK
jgi:methanogenic corrinoid protein MtbC1